ncbi:helix-turn-helix domain-containing protein [Pseudomonas aeruginosa]
MLRTFVSVVDTGNFTRAGEHLHLTQSTVSQQVIRLEQNLRLPPCSTPAASGRFCRPEEGEHLLATRAAPPRLSDEPARPSARPMATARAAPRACRKTSPAKC